MKLSDIIICVYWGLVELPYWFKVSFFAHNFGNSLQEVNTHEVKQKIYHEVRFNTYEVRLMLTSHQSDPLLLIKISGYSQSKPIR